MLQERSTGAGSWMQSTTAARAAHPRGSHRSALSCETPGPERYRSPPAGATAVGGNCGNGPEELVPVIEKMRAAFPDATIVAKGNVGVPQLVGMAVEYPTTPDTMADFARRFRNAGADVVGACCGSTPPHLQAMAEALRS